MRSACQESKAAQSYCCFLCEEGANYSKDLGPTDTNCSQPGSLSYGCKFAKSPSDGERAGFYILVETSSQHMALSWSLIPATSCLGRATRCTSARLQLARGQGGGKPREQRKYCSKERKQSKTFSFFPGQAFSRFIPVVADRIRTSGAGCPFPWTCCL